MAVEEVFIFRKSCKMSSGPVGSLCQAQFWPLDLMFDTHNERYNMKGEAGVEVGCKVVCR